MGYRIAHVLVRLIFLLLYRLRVVGRELVPEGAALVCANHTAYSDPVIMALALPNRDRVSFMAKVELFSVPLLSPLIRALGAYPVDRSRSDLTAIKKTFKCLAEGRKVILFPEGTRVKSDEQAEVKQGAVMFSVKTGAPIVPAYITVGRKLIVNRIEVIMGEPFWPQMDENLSKAENYARAGDELIGRIYALKAMTKRAQREKA